MDRGKGIMEDEIRPEGDYSRETERPSWVIDLQRVQEVQEVQEVRSRFRKSKMAVVKNQSDGWNYVEADKMEPDFDDIYSPYKVSLGPWVAFENGVPQEKMKKDNLVHFLKNSLSTVDQFYEGLRNDIKELRNTYSGLTLRWSEDDSSFLHMMLLDGCFILEFLRTTRLHCERCPLDNPVMSPVVQNGDDMKKYMHDVLLLRNQIPMKLLITLIRLDTVSEDFLWDDIRVAFTSHVSDFYDGFSPADNSAIYTMAQSLHLLDFHRRMLLQCDFNRGKTPRNRKKLAELTSTMATATEMVKMGLKFTTRETEAFLPRRLRTTLCLPRISLDASTKSLFFNMINFEKHNRGAVDSGLCQEIYLMGCLVKSPEDAKLLMSERVIVGLSSPNEVFQLLDRMMKLIPLESDDLVGSYNIETVSIVTQHMKLRQGWINDLFETYLKNPWSVLSIIVGLFLFAFGFLQTLYTIKGFYKQ